MKLLVLEEKKALGVVTSLLQIDLFPVRCYSWVICQTGQLMSKMNLGFEKLILLEQNKYHP